MPWSEASTVVSATGMPSRETRTAACPLVSIPETEFQNLSAVLKAASKSFDDVVRAGVFLTNITDFAAMNGIYAKYFSQPFLAPTTIAAAALPTWGLRRDRSRRQSLRRRMEVDLMK